MRRSRVEPAAASGDFITFQAHYPGGQVNTTVTIDVFSRHVPSDDQCFAQAQALVTTSDL